MAETVHLFGIANGTAIKGHSSQTSLGREDSIECVFWSSEVETAREKGSSLATGRRTYKPIIFRKRIDKSTPLLAKALCNNEVFEGVFKFFRPNPSGDGTTEQFFTVAFNKGRIASFKMVSPDCIDPAKSSEPPLEEIGIVFHEITWTYMDGGIEHHDNWKENT